jgi:hypothetical protein
MRLPNTAHTSRRWRIHELTHDFRVEDVWALPTPGGRNDFPRLVELISSFDPSRHSPAVRTLFAIRMKLGKLFGWDETNSDTLPFTALYETDDEWAGEVANRTVHAVIHLGWVPDEKGGYLGQMAILVKRNGWLGSAYMAAIAPFRYLIVYPQMLRQLGQTWREERAPR